MPTMANIVINDGAAAPVAHTFTPTGPDRNGVHYWHDRSGGVALGFPRISIDVRAPSPAGPGATSSSDRVQRVKVRMVVPIMETGVTTPTKAYDLTFNGEFILPERATEAECGDVLAYADNLLSDALMAALVEQRERVY